MKRAFINVKEAGLMKDVCINCKMDWWNSSL